MKLKHPIILLLPLLFIFSGSAFSSSPTILILGDSLSAAFGIPQEKGWVSLLQTRLKEDHFPHKVVNASISGETTAGGAARAEKLFTTYEPSVLILELGANDGLRGLSVRAMRDNLRRIIETAKQHNAQTIIVGMRLPPNYGAAYTRMFHKSYYDLANEYNLALVPFLFAGLDDSAKHFQADNLHPTALAQPILLNNIWPSIKQLIAPQLIN